MTGTRLTSNSRQKSVCVVGLGYVGLTLALTLQESGVSVYGVDVSPTVVEGVNRGRPHFYEKGLGSLLERHRKVGFRCFREVPDGKHVKTFIIAVGTSVRRRTPVFKELKVASGDIGSVLKKDDLVVLRSTVPVGSTREFVVRILEQKSGLTAGKDFSVAFAPERTVEGDALSELRTLPQIIGGIDKRSVSRASQLFLLFSPRVVLVESLEEAEMIKLLNNSYRDFSFAFSNEFALACDAFNLDAAKIIQTANHEYPRNKIPFPSPGVGGYCLSKDPHILHFSAKQRGFIMKLPRHARMINEEMPKYVYRQVIKFLDAHHQKTNMRHIALLGFAFKGNPPTSDTRFSPTVDVLNLLQTIPRIKLYGHDFVVSTETIANYGAEPIESIGDIFKGKHAVIIMNNHPRYKKLTLHHRLMKKPAFIFDAWSMVPKEKILGRKNVHYSNLGYDTI